ncbi:ion transporter [Planktomarina sp.]|uniref:potassium channel family protein n=1 Tax=Planktomarina sp. TaxID=2024851 RepID=UPI00288F7C7A|nr:ion transporter [Planktomarina sp.]
MSKYLAVQNRLNQILERADFGDRVSRSTDMFFTALVIVNIISITLESVPWIYAAHKSLFTWIEIISVGIFTIEYLCRVWVAPTKISDPRNFASACKSRAKYMLSFSGIVDLLSILPFYLRSFFPFLDLRILRALRLLRILKLSHYNSAMEDLFEAIFEERRSFYAASYLFAILFILSSTLMYFAEYRTHPTGFQSIPDSMYWALITLTTVGYGDITPITVAGKLIAVGSAILGVIVVAIITGIVASSFNAQMERRNIIFEDQVRKALLDGILDYAEKADLERLRKQFGMSKRRADALIDQVQSMRVNK